MKEDEIPLLVYLLFLVFLGFKLCSVWLQGHEGDLGEGDHSQGHGQSHR